MNQHSLPMVAQRFLKYVQIHTTSDPVSKTFPSSERQKKLSALLAGELKEMGVPEVHLAPSGYVYAGIPSNVDYEVPAIAFCSHIDTAPDCSGRNVKPIVHYGYQGQDIILPDDRTQMLSPAQHPYLGTKKGDTIITASGLTLLGADDKSGVAIIMTILDTLMQQQALPHGPVRVVFTPDEEVGRGTEQIDLALLNAKYGYTYDGGEPGTLEDETFSADGVKLSVHGVIAHPGYAKGKLVNALKVLGEILAALPTDKWAPEATEGREGFIHPVQIEGISELASAQFIVRDFDTDMLEIHENRLRQVAESIVSKYPGARLEMTAAEQYRNMKEILDLHPKVIEMAVQAYQKQGLTVTKEPIRGGTDGSRLSFMGLPTANLFTGMQAIHSLQEWIAVGDMEKAVATGLSLLECWANDAKNQIHLQNN